MRIFIVTFTRKAAVYRCAVCLEKDGGAGFEREPERELCVHILPYIYNSRISLACAKAARWLASCLTRALSAVARAPSACIYVRVRVHVYVYNIYVCMYVRVHVHVCFRIVDVFMNSVYM